MADVNPRVPTLSHLLFSWIHDFLADRFQWFRKSVGGPWAKYEGKWLTVYTTSDGNRLPRRFCHLERNYLGLQNGEPVWKISKILWLDRNPAEAKEIWEKR